MISISSGIDDDLIYDWNPDFKIPKISCATKLFNC